MKNPFAAVDRRVWIIFLIVFVNFLGFGIIFPLLPYYVENLQAGPLTVGLLISAYSLFQLLSAPILGELSDRYGRRPVLLFSLAGTALSFLLMGVANTLPLLFLSRIIDGASGGNVSTAQAYIADVTSREKRTQGMGVLAAAISLGFMIGPAFGGFLTRFGFAAPAFVAALISFIAFVLIWFYLPESRNLAHVVVRETKKRKLLHWRDFYDVLMIPKVGLIIVITFFVMLAFALMQGTFILLTAETLHFTPEQNGLLFTYIGILGIFIQLFFLRWITKRLSEKGTTILGIVSMAFGLGLVPFSSSVWLLLVAVTLIAGGNGISNPVLSGLTSKLSPESEQGNVMGISQSAGSVARLIGPIAGTFLFATLSPRSPYYFATVLLLLVAFVTYRYLHTETTVEKIKAKVQSFLH